MDEPVISIIDDPFGFYSRYYNAIATSRANAAYCEQLFGRDLGQHGFTEVSHLDHLAEISGFGPGVRALDLGCGDGRIAEYLSDTSRAQIAGIDWIPEAIRRAQARTEHKQDRLTFQVMDMVDLQFLPASFDVIYAIDTLYFTPLVPTLQGMIPLLKANGRIAVFFSQSVSSNAPFAQNGLVSFPPDSTGLADACKELGLSYQTWDYSHTDYEHAKRQQYIAESLQAEFIAEGNQFLLENHLAEAKGIQAAYEARRHVRYLYLITR